MVQRCGIGRRMAVMAAALALALGALGPGAGQAQEWAMSQFDDGSYFSATLAPVDGPGPALVCGERSPQGLSPRVTGNTEPDITPGGAFRVYLSDRAIGAPSPQRLARDDVMIVVGGATGYRLKGLRWNEPFSTWETDLPVNDPAFAAIAGAPRFELRYDGGRHALSSEGFRAGLGQLAGYCQSMFAAIGKPWAQAVAGGAAVGRAAGQMLAVVSMRQRAEADILRSCNGPAVKTAEAILGAQIDGDGVEDVIVDWRAVTCTGGLPQPFCGASMCSVGVYVSALFPWKGRPETLSALGVRLQPLNNGNDAVALIGSVGDCTRAFGRPDCDFLWYWRGTGLERLR
ncbi:MAG: hypothetical protein AB7S99_10230 [Pseudodonghicola sp.]